MSSPELLTEGKGFAAEDSKIAALTNWSGSYWELRAGMQERVLCSAEALDLLVSRQQSKTGRSVWKHVKAFNIEKDH